MRVIEGTTYDVYAVDGEEIILDHRQKCESYEFAEAYAKLFKKEYNPLWIYIVKHETFIWDEVKDDKEE